MNWPPEDGTPWPGLLSGVRILDFSLWLPGPFCTQLFADLGSDVVHIEPPEGDPGRGNSGWIYDAGHRNKRSLRADLKRERDLAACLALAVEADVVVVAYRPGTTERLGLGYEALRAINPRLVYCAITGYGSTGRHRDAPGHDLSYLAQAGALTGMPHWQPGPPRRSPVAIADLSAAFYAAFAILAALRHRDQTGEGSNLDVGIADAALAVTVPRAGRSFELDPASRAELIPTNDVFGAKDGTFVAVSAVEEKYWKVLRDTLGRYVPALHDSRFDDAAGRHRHGDDLQRLLNLAFGRETADAWAAMFEGKGPVEKVVSVSEAVRQERLAERGLLNATNGYSSIGFPVLRDGKPMGQVHRPPPTPGPWAADLISGDGVP